MQTVVVPSVPEGLKALADGGVLHAGNPQALDGLGASGESVDRAEDQLALPSGVAGVDDRRNIVPAHQLPQRVEAFSLVRFYGKTPATRQDRQVLALPLGVFGIVSGRIGQLRKMPDAP